MGQIESKGESTQSERANPLLGRVKSTNGNNNNVWTLCAHSPLTLTHRGTLSHIHTHSQHNIGAFCKFSVRVWLVRVFIRAFYALLRAHKQ